VKPVGHHPHCECPECLDGRDPLVALARLIGGSDPFAARMEYPNVRQVPWCYHTEAFGPVFAYRAAGSYAECVTWTDATVQVHHNDLLPFDPSAEGADLVKELDDDVSERMSPHMDGRSYKYSPPAKSTIGRYVLEMPHLFSNAVQPE
jgi:hypothetical protein